MKRNNISALIFIVWAAVGAAFLLAASGPPAMAQNCMQFRAIGQATLPTPHPLKPDDVRGGDFYGSLGGELLIGIFSGNDGNTKSQM